MPNHKNKFQLNRLITFSIILLTVLTHRQKDHILENLLDQTKGVENDASARLPKRTSESCDRFLSFCKCMR